jgi:hypothetical protein
MHPPRPILLRGEGLLRRGTITLATVHYELWHRAPATIRPPTREPTTRPIWSGTVQVRDVQHTWLPSELVWLSLMEDHYRLTVRLEGTSPRYIAVALTGFEPDPDP